MCEIVYLGPMRNYKKTNSLRIAFSPNSTIHLLNQSETPLMEKSITLWVSKKHLPLEINYVSNFFKMTALRKIFFRSILDVTFLHINKISFPFNPFKKFYRVLIIRHTKLITGTIINHDFSAFSPKFLSDLPSCHHAF